MARSWNLRPGCGSGVASWLIAAAALFPAGSGIARGDTLEVLLGQVTNTNLASETTPTLSDDGITNVVIYTRHALVDGVFQPGDIFYQRLSSQGVRLGSPVRVSNDLNNGTDDRLNDVSGPQIVYIALDPDDCARGLIRIYHMNDGSTLGLTSESSTVREAGIHGDTVAWVEGPPGSSRIEMVLLSAQSLEPITLSGAGTATGVDVGSRFVVWEEFDGASTDIVAYDLEAEMTVDVASTPANERAPATFDRWIVWEQRDDDTRGTSIWARNMDSPGEPAFPIASATSPSLVRRPAIDGGLIIYESRATGNLDLHVYRLLDGSTHRVTNAPTDEILSNVFGPLVAFVDVPAAVSPFEHDVYVTGQSTGVGGDPQFFGGDFDYATVKYSPEGRQLWVARYNGPGNAWDQARSLAVDSSGAVCVTGMSLAAPGDYWDYATVKYSPEGEELWVAHYNGPGNAYDQARRLVVDSSGAVHVTGYSKGAGPEGDYATVKYSPQGEELWVARYNGPGNHYDTPGNLAVDSDGAVYVTGTSAGLRGDTTPLGYQDYA